MIYKYVTLTLFVSLALPDILYGITTIHHDKPEDSRISEMATKMTETKLEVPSIKFGERQKRLLPYINYYISNNQQKPARDKFTPFLETNALPGPFIPIVKSTPAPSVQIEYPSDPPIIEKSPNYAVIYETLAQLKQAQQAMRHNFNHIIFPKAPSYIPVQYYEEPYRTKTVIETYTPTNIDLDGTDERKKYEPIPVEIYNPKPQVSDSYVIERPFHNYQTQPTKPYFSKPIVVYEEKPPEYMQDKKPVIYMVETTPKPQVNTIVDEKFVAQKFNPIVTTEEISYPNVQFVTQKPTYQEYYSSPTPNVPTENTNILAKILKQLQNSNTLPQTLTPQNIDNSIRTLVKILNGMRKQQKLKAKPIIVVEEEAKEDLTDDNQEEPSPPVENAKPALEQSNYDTPASFVQHFPANTIDGGTPGRPGIDYPALSSIPQTDFNCKKQRYKGFFGDPHTNCQVWHYCDLNGGQASFLCPNGTIFSQVALTCDWWYNVKCASTPQLYVLNERLYKYILPLAPKFPEDYSGPLVDRYLALKFQEMEEKMKKEKKKEETGEKEKDDSDQLQDIRNEKIKSGEET